MYRHTLSYFALVLIGLGSLTLALLAGSSHSAAVGHARGLDTGGTGVGGLAMMLISAGHSMWGVRRPKHQGEPRLRRQTYSTIIIL